MKWLGGQHALPSFFAIKGGLAMKGRRLRSRARYQIFNRILAMYSIIILLVISLLVVLIAKYVADDFITRSLEANEKQVEALAVYMAERERSLATHLRELYFYPELVESIAVALKNDPETYLEYRLDQYSLQRSFVPSNVESFMRGFYYGDGAIDAITLTSYETDQVYAYVFQYANWNRIQNEGEQQAITLTRPINDGSSTTGIGQLTAYYSSEALRQAVASANNVGFLQMHKEDGTLLFTNRPDPFELPQEEDSGPVYKEMVKNGETFYYKVEQDANRGLYYVGVVPRSEITELSSLVYATIALLIAVACVTVAVGYFVMRRYARRMQRIEASMQLVEQGDLSARIDMSLQNKKDELGSIAGNFNRMLDELKRYIDKSYVLELKKQEAEMRALQAQMNPHFLYNTLEAIRMKAVIEGATDAGAMTFHLASIMRYALSENRSATLGEELEHTKQYMALMEQRYRHALTVEYEVDSSLLMDSILRFSLQPLAENYMIHGFMPDKKDNRLHISIQKKEHVLTIVVCDNGKGMASERLEAIKAKLREEEYQHIEQSIGLANIHKRFQLEYGQPYGLSIHSVADEGTSVQLTCPLEREESDCDESPAC